MSFTFCTAPPCNYQPAGRYSVVVKVIDIFGHDSMALVRVNVS
jgi:hypothetical protein